MRKFLAINLIGITLLFCSVTLVSAVSKYIFYGSMLRDAGLQSVSLDDFKKAKENNTASLQTPTFIDRLLDRGSTPLPRIDTGYLLVLASELNPKDYASDLSYIRDFQGDAVIIICDSKVAISDILNCDFTNIEASPNVVSIGNINILKTIYQNKSVLIIPSEYLLSTEYSGSITDYIRAYNTSVYPQNLQNDSLFLENIDKNLLRIFLYSFTVVLLIIPFKRYVKILVLNPRMIFQSQIHYNALKGIESWIILNRSLYFNILSVLLIIYVAALSLISIRDVNIFSLTYIANYLTSIITSIVEFHLADLEPVKLFIAILTAMILLVLVIILIPSFIAFFRTGTLRILKTNISVFTYKFIYTTIFISLTEVLILFNIKDSAGMIIFLSSILSLTFIQQNIRRVELRYSTFEKRLILSVTIFLVLLGSLVKYSQYNNPSRANQFLVNPSSRLVVLPYTTSYKQGYIYRPFIFNTYVPIFINNRLISHPNYKEIKSLPIKEFEDSGNFIITNETPSLFAAEIIRNKSFRDWYLQNVTDDTNSMFYIIPDFKRTAHDKFTVEISYLCTVEIPANKFTLRVFHNNYTFLESPYEEIDFLYNPGCNANERHSTVVPIDLSSVADGLVLVNIRSSAGRLDDLGIKTSFRLAKNGKFYDLQNINYSGAKTILYEKYRNINEPLKQYYFSPDPMITFSRDSDKIDLSAYINNLIKSGLLNNPFKIWSTQDNVFIKNVYE